MAPLNDSTTVIQLHGHAQYFLSYFPLSFFPWCSLGGNRKKTLSKMQKGLDT